MIFCRALLTSVCLLVLVYSLIYPSLFNVSYTIIYLDLNTDVGSQIFHRARRLESEVNLFKRLRGHDAPFFVAFQSLISPPVGAVTTKRGCSDDQAWVQ